MEEWVEVGLLNKETEKTQADIEEGHPQTHKRGSRGVKKPSHKSEWTRVFSKSSLGLCTQGLEGEFQKLFANYSRRKLGLPVGPLRNAWKLI